jgi:hypothetical protein
MAYSLGAQKTQHSEGRIILGHSELIFSNLLTETSACGPKLFMYINEKRQN